MEPFMRKKTVALLCSLFIAAVAVAGLVGPEAAGGSQGAAPAGTGRSDLIIIDALSRLGPLEEQKVVFLHDKHTEALTKGKDWAKKGCLTCHPADKDGKMDLAFMKPLGASKAAARDVYHDGCIGCHKTMAAAGEKTGPQAAACRDCHKTEPGVADARQAVVVDKVLHYRHTKAYEKDDKKCGVCHHRWDEKAGKVVPTVKETEVAGACNYCHLAQPVVQKGAKPEIIRSGRQAAHGECVSCHLKRATEPGSKIESPYTCAGCHDAASQAKASEKNKKVAAEAGDALRMKRGQPDAALVAGSVPFKAGAKNLPLGVVPFNHKAHEGKVATCQACHHGSLESCSASCHTVAGSKKGGWVTLEQAFHKRDADQSCVGCHSKAQAAKDCVGCHGIMNNGASMEGKSACAPCHKAVDGPLPASVEDQAGRQAMADALLKARTAPAPLTDDDIPEKVTIKVIVDKYEASEFPHRKIVRAMLASIKDDPMAKTFHGGQYTVCASCHHNSPADKNPPRCASCHAGSDTGAKAGRPALKAAYHGQCMGCHTKMGIEGKVYSSAPGAKAVPANTQCEGCHKVRAGQAVKQ